MLLRSGVLGVSAFLQRLGELLTRVYRMPGRFKQSLAESSFDAWDILYRPEAEPSEHGDQLLHEGRAGRARARPHDAPRAAPAARSLDDVVRELWRRYGARGIGVPERRLRAARRPRSSGSSTARLLRRSDARHRGSRRCKELLAEFGVDRSSCARRRAPTTAAARRAPQTASCWRSASRYRERELRSRAHHRARRRTRPNAPGSIPATC